MPYDDYRNTKLASEVNHRVRLRKTAPAYAAAQNILDFKGLGRDIGVIRRDRTKALGRHREDFVNLRSLQCAWKTATSRNSVPVGRVLPVFKDFS